MTLDLNSPDGITFYTAFEKTPNKERLAVTVFPNGNWILFKFSTSESPNQADLKKPSRNGQKAREESTKVIGRSWITLAPRFYQNPSVLDENDRPLVPTIPLPYDIRRQIALNVFNQRAHTQEVQEISQKIGVPA